MENNHFGKKITSALFHQLALLVSVLSCYSADYYFKHLEMRRSYILMGVALLAMIMVFVTLVSLANAISLYQGRNLIGPDIQFILYAVSIIIILNLLLPINQQSSLPDRLVTIGVVEYLLDSWFLLLFVAFVSRIRAGVFVEQCLIYRLFMLVKRILFEHTIFTRALRGLIAWSFGMIGVAIYFAYGQWWGLALLLVSAGIELYFSLQKAYEEKKIRKAIITITKGNLDSSLNVSEFHGEQCQTAEAVNHIRDGLDNAVKEGIKNERMKADLITNVSHDLKTPLTSIINYVNILKKKIPETDETWQYLAILEEKSMRLKTLLEDLLEVSRLTSGTVKYDICPIDFLELIYEIGGEFDERFEKRGLTIVTKLPHLPMMIEADGRQLSRAIENLYTNAAKYAKLDSHVMVELKREEDEAVLTIRNVMQQALETKEEAVDLTERFVRGDKARTSEGSGLGLSITKEIVTQMGGAFYVTVEEDIYSATVKFKIS